MDWYLVYTKPRQESRALQNLEEQGYECYLPAISSEKSRHNVVEIASEPLFPRYLFIRLSQDHTAKSWSPIRSTKGVSKLVSFGKNPARIDDALVEHLRTKEALDRGKPKQLFQVGDKVRLTDTPFAGIEGIYQMHDGQQRAIILIELLSRPVIVSALSARLRKVS